MITNPSPLAAARAAAFHRLSRPGYRGPLVLAALLATVAAAPDGLAHEAVVAGTATAGLLVMVPVTLLTPVAVPVAVVLALALAGLAASPAARSRARTYGRRLHRPGDSALLGIALASGAVVLGSSVPGQDYGLLGAGLATLALLPFGWLARQARHRTSAPRGLWRWAAVPLLVGTAALLVGHDVPREARFALARPALTSAAEHALTTGSTDRAPTWIGGYPVQDAELTDGGVKFTLSGSGIFARHGYAYFPPGGPTRHRDRYTQLTGTWYTWSGPDHF
ncbi:hypothetical protein GCM10009665_04680 [Kitasatospora nipponensis]|uniref:Uncharacterized protein n=1 Tax=Kitasatospora nipponensis TaxID=258049 RepID=A0ABN1VNQ2_9ACTN